MSPILVRPFTQDEFNIALSNGNTSPMEVGGHSRVTYLHGYLTDLGVKSILVEEVYTDADFLDDYAAYYAKCFSAYNRRCKRIQLFQT
jgi:hypothetical protein